MVKKSQLSTLIIIYLIFFLTDLLFNFLFLFKYYFSIFFYYFFLFLIFLILSRFLQKLLPFTRLFFLLLYCFPFISSVQRTHKERWSESTEREIEWEGKTRERLWDERDQLLIYEKARPPGPPQPPDHQPDHHRHPYRYCAQQFVDECLGDWRSTQKLHTLKNGSSILPEISDEMRPDLHRPLTRERERA